MWRAAQVAVLLSWNVIGRLGRTGEIGEAAVALGAVAKRNIRVPAVATLKVLALACGRVWKPVNGALEVIG